jgi:hypothetical protein
MIGQKLLLKLKETWTIRNGFEMSFNLAIDSAYRIELGEVDRLGCFLPRRTELPHCKQMKNYLCSSLA